ncbi:peptidylprolyl isomerase [Hymenobacter psychrotolerans]|uniref:peptidylprolyl isomerase n=1 Tax=Hymenobacter psychrotolerans DSM 18569 TaxID=1121959 RepID=A0A1M7BG02_9BACT|nr:peptidylprolyl isomerase [Hymenobacter psychrotolerans]SHL53539.1 outer membrane autotransporter barrel domain-containing protein [Hymenobacter psychrotolerans DSM 18569]
MTYSVSLRAFLALSCAATLLAACAPAIPKTSAATAVPPLNQFADATLRLIGTAQDERNTTALLPYLAHPESRYRQAAALALASVQDKAATAALLPLLGQEQKDAVRRAAAYALGQTGDSTAAETLAGHIMTATTPQLRRYLSEALGRCVTQKSLRLLAQGTFSRTDTVFSTGQAWGLFRAGSRGITSEAAVARAVALLATRQPVAARQGAAFTLARTPRLDLTAYQAALVAATSDADPTVRAMSASALGKVKTPSVAPVLASLARRDADHRVRVSALRAMNAGMYAPVKETAWQALTDPSSQVAVTAAEFFLTHAAGEPGILFLEKANRINSWRVRSTLLAAALKLAGPERNAIRTAVQQRYSAATDPYEKGYLLKALGEDPAAYEFVEQATFASGQPLVVGSYGMEALVAMRRRPGFPEAQQAAFALTLRRAIAGGDVTVMGTAAEALRDPQLNMRRLLPNPDFLVAARDKLVLPRDLEAWQSLQQTIDYMQQKPAAPVPVAKAASHPINWELVQTIPDRQRVLVRTTQGDVTMVLLVNDAPGSVASFVELVRQGFYDGRFFHRVVPNFVAQGGCPRGDGSGSTDYNLRSEFSDLRYGEGAVGLASSGKDTESCQWFITHAPTPHLDGRYTIFAQVVQGMDVVQRLDIGDKIMRVELVR